MMVVTTSLSYKQIWLLPLIIVLLYHTPTNSLEDYNNQTVNFSAFLQANDPLNQTIKLTNQTNQPTTLITNDMVPSIAPIGNIPTASPVDSFGLTLQDVNILVVTDVHSWVAGHNKNHEPTLDIDYGDVLSFYIHLQQEAEQNHKDIIFVMNGDFLHGSALSQNPPKALAPILQHMPWDLVTLGNHDIELKDTIQYLHQPGALIDSWGPALVTSNILYGEQPFGHRYRFIHLPRANQTILCFGFLYNMQDNDPTVTVENVQDVIQAEWFTTVLQQEQTQQPYHAILILAHMDANDTLVHTLLTKIRTLVGTDMVIQFITGHTHKRDYVLLDQHASSLQAGFFLDTLGFVSFQTTAQQTNFYHSLMDANKQVLLTTLAVEDMDTNEGTDLKEFILAVADSLGANEVIGCAPQTYYLDAPITETDSLHRLYLQEIIPSAFLDRIESPPDMTNVLVQSLPFFLRYHLFEGEVTINDIHNIISDDDDIYRVAHSLRGDKIQRLAGHLANKSTFLNGTSPTAVYTLQDGKKEIDPHASHELFVVGREVEQVSEILTGERVMHPLKDLVDNGETTIRSIWIDFIRHSWECGRDPGYSNGQSVGEDIPVADENNDTIVEGVSNTEGDVKKVMDNAGGVSVVGAILGTVCAIAFLVILARAVPSYLRRRKRQQMREQQELDDPVTTINHVVEIT